jgi:hypothetical protein
MLYQNTRNTILELFFKRNKKEKEKDDNRAVNCKHCDMRFKDKERLKVHSRIAHTGRGERKKKDHGF